MKPQVALDLVRRFHDSKAIVIRLNHSKLAEAVCSWAGVPQERRRNVAEVCYFSFTVSVIFGIILSNTYLLFCSVSIFYTSSVLSKQGRS